MALEEEFNKGYSKLKTADDMERLLESYEFFGEQLSEIRLSQSSIPVPYNTIMIVGKARGDVPGVAFGKSWKELHDDIRKGAYEGFVIAYQLGSGRGVIMNADEEFRTQETSRLYRVPDAKEQDEQKKTQVLPALRGV